MLLIEVKKSCILLSLPCPENTHTLFLIGQHMPTTDDKMSMYRNALNLVMDWQYACLTGPILSWSSYSCEPAMAMKTFSFGQRMWIKACMLPASVESLRVKCWLLAISHPTRFLLALTLYPTLTWCQSFRSSNLCIHYARLGRLIHTDYLGSRDIILLVRLLAIQKYAFLLICNSSVWLKTQRNAFYNKTSEGVDFHASQIFQDITLRLIHCIRTAWNKPGSIC